MGWEIESVSENIAVAARKYLKILVFQGFCRWKNEWLGRRESSKPFTKTPMNTGVFNATVAAPTI
jgi:hypothetical protein